MVKKGFTLIEILVAVIIIGILATTASVFFKPDYNNQKKCAENLRVISNAIEAYREAHGEYPPATEADLKAALTSVPAANFVCPSDAPGSTDSYSEFYVKRNDYSGMNSFSLGCPRHESGKYAMNLFFQGQIMKRQLVDATSGGAVLKPGAIASDTVNLGGGSTVSAAGNGVTFIQSFDIGNGKTYSLFKTDAAPKDININCMPGNRLEIITPAAIAGVEGTNFTVSVIDADNTAVSVASGTVFVEEITGKGKINVSAGHKARIKKSHKPDIDADRIF